MPKVVRGEIAYPSKLMPEEQQRLSESLYRVHERIFKGLNKREFDHYVINSPADFTKIFTYRNKRKKEIIGYFAVHRFEKYIHDQPSVIFRAEAGLVPEYRRENANLSFWLMEAIKFKTLHPSRKAYFLCSPVNPSMYAILAKYTYKIYPKYDSSIPSEVEKLMMRLADEFGLEKADENNPLLRKVGWITQVTYEEKAFWQSSQNPHVRFYMNANSGFDKGNGLLTLVPLTFLNLFISFFGFIFYTLKKKMRSNLRRLLA